MVYFSSKTLKVFIPESIFDLCKIIMLSQEHKSKKHKTKHYCSILYISLKRKIISETLFYSFSFVSFGKMGPKFCFWIKTSALVEICFLPSHSHAQFQSHFPLVRITAQLLQFIVSWYYRSPKISLISETKRNSKEKTGSCKKTHKRCFHS